MVITVAGSTGAGTSAISQLLNEFLSEKGFNSTLKFNYDEHAPRSEDNLRVAVDSIRPRLEIVVKEVKLPRTGCTSEVEADE